MKQFLKNADISRLFFCLIVSLLGIRTKGFLSFLFFYIFHSYKCWTSVNSKPQRQSSNIIPKGVRLSKEEAVMVMGGLGLNVESDGKGLDEVIGEHEVEELFEKEPSFEEVKDAFEVFDENRDGFIEARELQRVLKCLGLERDSGECERMVSAFDQNGDGVIDLYEFVKLMEQCFDAS